MKKEHNRLQSEVLKTKGRVELESKEEARHLVEDAEARAKKIVNRARSEARAIVGDAEKRLIELQAQRDAIAAYIGDLNLAVGEAARKAGEGASRRRATRRTAAKPAARTAAKPAVKAVPPATKPVPPTARSTSSRKPAAGS
ncbi:unannotated protein [freshwater metagenome]|uniref:Unannotated protein n=1 Tax=freshwater metagenome TaxID=449393 RepID=A0A6J6G2S3_9ZZZZ